MRLPEDAAVGAHRLSYPVAKWGPVPVVFRGQVGPVPAVCPGPDGPAQGEPAARRAPGVRPR